MSASVKRFAGFAIRIMGGCEQSVVAFRPGGYDEPDEIATLAAEGADFAMWLRLHLPAESHRGLIRGLINEHAMPIEDEATKRAQATLVGYLDGNYDVRH